MPSISALPRRLEALYQPRSQYEVRKMARLKSSPRSNPKAARVEAKIPDAVELLKQDHDTVDGLFKEFDSAKQSDDQPAKAEAAARICNELTIHATIEEEIFYPAARDALGTDGDDLLDEAEVEHETAKALIAQLAAMSPDEDLYDAKVAVLGEYIRHHVKEEESELFPLVKETDLDLEELGTRLKARKDVLHGEFEEQAVS
jgi:hemerythrin superfamily protein